MAIQSSYRTVNPRLKTHYAIYSSAVTCLVMLLIILEQLGFNQAWLSHIMIVTPVLFVLAIGVMAFTRDLDDFHTSGRRVPAAFNGFALVMASFGGVGLLGLTGALFFNGFDALSLVLGWTGGFVLMAVLFLPNLRRAGTFTLPGFLAVRFDSQALRIAAAAILLVPLFLILIAELKAGAFAASLVIGLSRETLIWICGLLLVMMVIWGGMRSLTWTQCALFILLIAGVLTPLTILAIQLTNLPFPQLTYGTLLGDLGQLELASALAGNSPAGLAGAIPAGEPARLSKPFLQAFGSLSRADFFALTLSIMLGVAALPSLLARAGSAVSVHGARNSAGWGLFLLAIFLISAPAYAVFSKYIVLRGLLGQPVDLAPEWSQGLISKGLLALNDQNQDSRLELTELAFARDGVMFFLPIAAEFPVIIATLTVSAVIGGALAGGAAQTITIAAILSGDLYHRVLFRSASPASQVTAGRIAIGLTVICAVWLAINSDADGFRLFVWSLSLCASSIFPVLLLSIWWKKCSAPGALAGLLAGFATASGYIYSTEFLGQQLWFGIDPIAAAVFGAPAAGLAALSVSYLTPSKPQGDKTPTTPLMAGDGQGLYGGSQRSAAPGLGT